MTGNGDSFIGRWSKRKAEAAAPESVPPPAVAPAAEISAPAEAAPETPPEPAPPLPSLDDVSPGRDIAAFFGKHVPEELRNAALRKAWTGDPAISGFIEMAENQWDFNSPGGALAAGFGAMPAGFDAQALAESIMGTRPPQRLAETGESAETIEAADAGGDAALQQVESKEASANPAAASGRQLRPVRRADSRLPVRARAVRTDHGR